MEIVFSNDGFYEMYGYTKEQLNKEVPNMLDLIFDEDRKQTMETVARIVRDRGSETYEYRCHKRDGGTVYIQCTNSVISLAGFDGPVLLAVTTDITALREAQEEKNATMDRLRTVMNTMPGGMTAVSFRDDGMKFLFANDRYYELHGIKRGSIGENHLSGILDLIVPEDRERMHNTVHTALQSGKTMSAEYRIQRPDGNIRWLHSVINMTKLVGIDEPVQIAVFSDITDIKEANSQLRFLNSSARGILTQPDNNLAIEETLQSTMQYFGAARAYVMEEDIHHRYLNNTYEVCAEGVESIKDKRQNIPAGLSGRKSDNYVVFEDVAGSADIRQAFREMLLQQGVFSTAIVPLYRNGVSLGTVAVDNPTKALKQVGQLTGIADCIAFVLTRRDLNRKIERDTEAMQTLMNDTPGGFVRMAVRPGKSPTIVSLNDGMCRMLGMTNGEVMAAYGSDAHLLFTPEEIEETAKKVSDALHNCGQYSCKCTLHCKDGKNLPVMAFGRFVKDEKGDIFLNSYFTDISEKLGAEEKQKLLLDNLPTGAALYEFDGKDLTVIHINKQYWKLVKRDGIGTVMGALHPDDRPAIRQEIESSIRQNRNPEVNCRILCGDGSYQPFHVIGTITPMKNGHFLLCLSYSLIDEHAMSIQQMLPIALSTVIAASDDISYVKDRDLRYMCVSQSLARIAGVENARDLIGKSADEVFAPQYAKKLTGDDQRILDTGEPVIGTIARIPYTDGSIRLGRTSKFPIMDAYGKAIGVYCTYHDVTAQKQNETQLELLTSTIPGGLATFRCTEKEYHLSYYNDGFCALFGYPRAEFDIPLPEIMDHIFKQDRTVVDAQVARLVNDGTPVNCVYRIHTKDGRYRWVSHNAVLVDRENDVAIINAVFLDITEQQEEKERLRLAEEEYRIATRHSKHTIGRYDIAQRTLTISEEASVRLALPETIPDVPYGRVKFGRISKATASDYIAFYEKIINGERECSVTFQKLLSTGWRWITEHATTIFNDEGKPVSAIISYMDVTDQQEKEAVYKKWQQSLTQKGPNSYTLYRCNLNQDSSYDSVEGSLLNIHESWSDSDSMSFNERTADFAHKCVVEEDLERYLQFVNSDTMLANYYRGRRTAEMEFRAQIATSEIHWLKLSVELVEYPNTKDISAYLMFEDINESKTAEIRTLEDAETDPLTGLLNRKTFFSRVDAIIRRSSSGSQHAFYMLDIDGFKLLNDTFGHAAGDEALVEIAQKLQSLLRSDDLLGRLGGDEFVLFLKDMSDASTISKKAEQLCNRLAKSYKAELRITASIGVALYPCDGASCQTLYEKADTALYASKESGRNTFRIYSAQMPEKTEGADTHEMLTDASANPVMKKKIRRMLIVDDSQIDLTVLKNLFDKEYLVDVALDGMSALSRMRYYGSALSVVLLDLNMKGLSGFDVLAKAKSSPEMQDIPIIVVSGENDTDTCIRAIRAGATDFVTKPVQPELIRPRVAAAVSQAENERLRAQNSFLQLHDDEISRYQTALNGMGMFVIELDWLNGTFIYDSTISHYLKGTYNSRSLWHILLSDMVARAVDVRRLQTFIHKLADDHSRERDEVIIPLKTASGATHRFNLTAQKICNDKGIAQKLIITFKDIGE